MFNSLGDDTRYLAAFEFEIQAVPSQLTKAALIRCVPTFDPHLLSKQPHSPLPVQFERGEIPSAKSIVFRIEFLNEDLGNLVACKRTSGKLPERTGQRQPLLLEIDFVLIEIQADSRRN